MSHDSGRNLNSADLESVMGGAVSGLNSQLLNLDVPEFSPTPRRAPVMALALILVGLGAFAISWSGESDGDDNDIRITTPAGDPTTAPATNEVVVDAAFGAKIERITDSAPGEFIMPLADAWNGDGTRILLYRTDTEGGGRHQIYDADTFELLRELSLSPSDIEQVYWDPNSVNDILFVDGNVLFRVDTTSGLKSWITTLEGCESVSMSSAALSWDGSLLVGSCELSEPPAVATPGIFAYRFDVDGTFTGGYSRASSHVAAPMVLASGNGLLIPVELDGEIVWQVFDTGLSSLGVTIDGADLSLDTGLAADGSDIVLGPGYGVDLTGTLVIWDPLTGEGRVIIGPATGFSYPPSGTQLSASSTDGSGRVVVSVQGDGSADGDLAGELLAVTVNSSEQPVSEIVDSLRRLANHHSSGETQASDYWATVFLAVSPDGQQMLFSSDWQSGQQVDTFVVSIN